MPRAVKTVAAGKTTRMRFSDTARGYCLCLDLVSDINICRVQVAKRGKSIHHFLPGAKFNLDGGWTNGIAEEAGGAGELWVINTTGRVSQSVRLDLIKETL